MSLIHSAPSVGQGDVGTCGDGRRPCQRSTLTIYGKAGAGVKIMGVSVGEKSVEVFKKEFKKVVPDRKACDI